jgi:hypothetical protein
MEKENLRDLPRHKALTYPRVFAGLMVAHMGSTHPSDVVMDRCAYRIHLETYLRKEHEGSYYFVHFSRSHDLQKSGPEAYNEIMELMNHFHGEVYRWMQLGVIDLDMVDVDGNAIHIKDDDDTEEGLRLLRLQYPATYDESYPRSKTNAEIAWEWKKRYEKEMGDDK